MKEVAHGIPMSLQPASVRPSQERTVGGLALAMLIAFCAIGIHSDAYAAQSADVDELLSAVIASLEQGQPELRAGRGTAFVTETNRGVTTRKTVHFMFGEDCARSDVYLDQNGSQGGMEFMRSRTPRGAIYLREHSARILPSDHAMRLHGFYQYEISPESASRLPIGSVVSILKFLADQPTTTVRLDDDGFLRIDYVFPEEDGATGASTMILDPAHGYRLMEYSDASQGYNGEGSENECRYVLTWEDSGGVSYIGSMRYRQRSLRVEESGEPCEPYESVFEKTVQIQTFEPNVALNADDFTLVGMGIGSGVTVVDDIVGVVYNYGDDPAAELDLKLAVDEGLAQVGMEMPGGSASDGMGTGETQASPASGASSGSHAAPWSLLAMAGAGVVVVLGVLWRLRTRRRDA